MSSGTTRAYDVLCEAKFDYFKSMIGYVCETQRDYCRIMMDCKSVTSTGAVEEYVRDPEGLLRSWVRIPPGAWIFVCCECRVLSGRGLCDELIARPEESYRLCCVVVCDLETSRMVAPYIYIYDISNLRVNGLTLILLTWRK